MATSVAGAFRLKPVVESKARTIPQTGTAIFRPAVLECPDSLLLTQLRSERGGTRSNPLKIPNMLCNLQIAPVIRHLSPVCNSHYES
jgi:hypothetical protein